MVRAQFEHQDNSRHSSNPRGAVIIAAGIASGFVIVIYIVLNFFFNYNSRVTNDGPGQRAATGLDPSVLETFPVFRYSEVAAHMAGTGPLECSVCLSSFDDEEGDDEKLRLLPKCNHVFHVGCVDPWLKDHSTCPLCRTSLVPESDELSRPDGSQIPGPSTREGVDEIVNGTNDEGDIEKGQIGKYKRWKSMEHVAEAEPMGEDGWKRFTLKLSKEEIKKMDNKNGKLERAKSWL